MHPSDRPAVEEKLRHRLSAESYVVEMPCFVFDSSGGKHTVDYRSIVGMFAIASLT